MLREADLHLPKVGWGRIVGDRPQLPGILRGQCHSSSSPPMNPKPEESPASPASSADPPMPASCSRQLRHPTAAPISRPARPAGTSCQRCVRAHDAAARYRPKAQPLEQRIAAWAKGCC